jgi:hypothetical protein
MILLCVLVHTHAYTGERRVAWRMRMAARLSNFYQKEKPVSGLPTGLLFLDFEFLQSLGGGVQGFDLLGEAEAR